MNAFVVFMHLDVGRVASNAVLCKLGEPGRALVFAIGPRDQPRM